MIDSSKESEDKERGTLMGTDPRVGQLLEEIVASGRTPEEVCHGCRELLPAVLHGLRQVRALEAEVAELFPTRAPVPADDRTSGSSHSAILPCIPGYTVLSELGRGGMGVVYKARHQKLDRIVALKMLLVGVFATPAELARLLREAQALAGLRHPHIVQVYDTGDLDGRPYFTMEYLDGGSLAQKLAAALPTARQAASTVATLADAVHIAHAGGIIHRDLKPTNILLTSDGIPKVADFGLARWYEKDLELTLGGARLGTLSYMSPEQAIGREGTVGPPTDIYSLGAVLYEMLTGRPPFRGDCAAETERQLFRDEPVPPSQLNRDVPRDIDVICLKCLHKSPASRYASAQALADDLRRFEAGEPISARSVGIAERAGKWVRRSPAKAVLIGSLALAALAAGGASLWMLSARASRIAAAEADLGSAIQFQRKGDWTEAGSALDRATIRLADGGSAELRKRIDRAQAELALVSRLDAIRLLRAGSTGGVLNNERAAREYADVFLTAGLGRSAEAPATVANRIREAVISQVFVAALDDWLLASSDAAQRQWIDAVVQLADLDEDPSGWRRSARDSIRWRTPESITLLADEAPVSEQPISFLYAFSEAMAGAEVDNLPFLTRAQHAHPDDFWLTTAMANALNRHGRHADSIGYYRAAVALRPDVMAVHYNLGRALGKIGQNEEAIACLRRALEQDPGAIDPRKSLGLALSNTDRYEDALEQYLLALRHDANDHNLYLQLSWCYANLGRYPEAAQSYERSLELGPKEWQDTPGTRRLLLKQGQHELVTRLWKKQLALRVTALSDWDGYAELSLFTGDVSEYERARGELLDRFGKVSDPNECERVGRACLLLPPSSPEQFSRAIALIDRSLASPTTKQTWAYPYFRFARALADYRAGDFAEAAAIVEGESAGVLGPAPRLVAAMCRARMGEGVLARRHLAEAVVGFDWTVSAANYRESWIYHTLRREAEAIVLPDLVALVRGESEPVDDQSRLALLGACHSAERLGRCARLWSDVLSGMNRAPERFVEPAARALVLAASGAGIDASHFSEADRTAWRDLGLALLSDRLDALVGSMAADSARKHAARTVISGWEAAPEFRSVRGEEAIGTMPEPERARWSSFWTRAKAAVEPAEAKRP